MSTSDLLTRLESAQAFASAREALETGRYSSDYQSGVNAECIRRVPLDKCLRNCVAFLEKAGTTHSTESGDDDFVAGYMQAMEDIREWVRQPLAALSRELESK